MILNSEYPSRIFRYGLYTPCFKKYVYFSRDSTKEVRYPCLNILSIHTHCLCEFYNFQNYSSKIFYQQYGIKIVNQIKNTLVDKIFFLDIFILLSFWPSFFLISCLHFSTSLHVTIIPFPPHKDHAPRRLLKMSFHCLPTFFFFFFFFSFSLFSLRHR